MAATATKTKIKFRPLDDRVLVAQGDAEEVTAGGIVLPDSAREKPQRGTVVAAGPGKMLDNGQRGPLEIKIDDEIFYGKYSGTEVEIGGDKYVILKESDILAVLDK